MITNAVTLPNGGPGHEGEFAARPLVRFGATFVSNVLRAGISFVTALLVARGLGAKQYGDLSFLLGTFAGLLQALDSGTTPAFFTLLSSRPRRPLFFVLYAAWTIGVQFGVTLLILAVIMPQSLVTRIWIGHERTAILLAFTASFVTSQIWGTVVQMGEAARKTIIVQGATAAQALLHLVVILVALRWHWLSIKFILTLLIAEYIALALVVAPRLIKFNVARDAEVKESAGEIIRQFAVYCAPLLLYSVVTCVYAIADRWLLQRYGGSAQQGFFAVGQQFATIGLLATTSIVSVFWKEVAEANARGNLERVRQLYRQVRRLLYFGAAAISCGLIPYSREILHWTVGHDYEAGAFCLALMLLYPIHQALGYVQGTFYLAVGDTKRYTLAGIIMMIVSIPVTYLMVAPPSAHPPGFALGATGVAVKMVVLQIGAIAVQMRLIQRAYDLAYDFAYQALTVAALLGLAFMAKIGVGAVMHLAHLPKNLFVVMTGGVIYVVIVAAAVCQWPLIAGINPIQIQAVAKRMQYLAHGRRWTT